ncbi:hypothetical protein E2562_020237 [Oryza meyeriana var. granulata]|uniref:AAA+ ATPase domain-containing protein n=1 Tax=Oryza meyeriana var. granulata TaxID=110450 RepID=A0A6G1DKD6_9ORYZ|nr:hypothetical protein E2562_020237 [Oryza meyeriana var. granulata]
MDLTPWMGPVNSGLVLLILTMLLPNLNLQTMQAFVARKLSRRTRRLAAYIDPYLSITIHEYEAGRMTRSSVFAETKAYLDGAVGSRDGVGVRHLNAEDTRGGGDKVLVLSMADGEEVADNFSGATLWWSSHFEKDDDKGSRASPRRSYRLVFHERHRDLVRHAYLPYVRERGRAFMAQSRRRKIYTNIASSGWRDDGNYTYSLWTEAVFEPPKTFDTLGMDPAKKKEIMDDLDMFKNGKEHHRRVGKAWKRGYLLYGPPGTGKSTMVAAMASYLSSDVYDLELTSVETSTDLRKLLLQTTSKSIIVIEDVDCSSNLTGQRKAGGTTGKDGDAATTTPKIVVDRGGGGGHSKVTLSGLLNFIDGLWSAFGEERLIVLTTNHVEDLDLALIRTGRMDKKIEMSYCDLETFKSMAKIYLDVDVDSHKLFPTVEDLLREVELVPADVGEHLTPANPRDDADSCLARLVNALQKAKANKDAAANAQGQDEHTGAIV